MSISTYRHLFVMIMMIIATPYHTQANHQFIPPYADPSFLCRCISPSYNRAQSFGYHRSICEYKAHISSLQHHVAHIIDLLVINNESAASWFFDQCTFLREKIAQTLEKCLATDARTSSEDKLYIENLCVILRNHEELPFDEASRAPGKLSLQDFKDAIERLHIKSTKKSKLVSFFESAAWLAGTALSLTSSTNLMQDILPLLHIKDIREKIKIPILEKALALIEEHGDPSLFIEIWELLAQYDPEENRTHSKGIIALLETGHRDATLSQCRIEEHELSIAFLLLKEFATIIALFNHQIFVALQATSEPRSITAALALAKDVATIYSIIQNLPIRETVYTINNLVESCYDTAQQLNQADQKISVAWFKELWVKIPVALGVVVLKIFEHYATLYNKPVAQTFSMHHTLNTPLYGNMNHASASTTFFGLAAEKLGL